MTTEAAPAALPEQVFFADPALDRLLAVTLTLAAEVHILRDRVRALEADRAGTVAETTPDDVSRFVTHLLTPLLGEQQAKGPL